MDIFTTRQLFQSAAQFIATVVTGMLAYQTYSKFAEVGWQDALWQPVLQGLMNVLVIYGVSKVGPK